MKTFLDILAKSKTGSGAFPFGFVLDQEMRVLEVGRSLQQLVPAISIGSRIDEALEFVIPKRARAWTIDFFEERTGELIVFKERVGGVRLRAECFVADGKIAVNATPAVTTHDALEKLGLSFGNFPLTDSISDTVFVLSMQYQTLRETELMTREISESNDELKVEVKRREEIEDQLRWAHEQLRHRNRELSVQKDASEAQAHRYKDLMDNIPGVFYRCECDEQSTMDHISFGIEKLSGFHVAEIAGNQICSFASLIHPADSEMVERSVFEAVKSNQSWDIEYRLRTKEGSFTWVSEQGVGVYDKHGEVEFLTGFVADITERKSIEEALITASRKAGKAEIATGVLHNVGNVMNSVNVSVGLLENTVRDSLQSRLSGLVNLLEQHENDLANFLSNDSRGKHFLPFVKLLGKESTTVLDEIKELQNHVGHVNAVVASQQSYATTGGTDVMAQLSDIVDDAIRIVSIQFSESQVEIVSDFDSVPSVSIDKQRLIQVLVNLLSNARLAIEDNNSDDKLVTVRIRKSTDDALAIEIIDSGIGIAPENVTNLFKHGFSTRKNRGGHGFGLHHSFNAMVEVGGNLKVHSEGEGLGSVFTVELPINHGSPVVMNA